MKNLTLTLLTIFYSLSTFAQVKINFPVNRAVFQRNFLNEADVPITGSLGRKAERVEARFIPINGQGVDDGTWHIVQNNANQGFFSGKVKVRGGWYRLEVRSILGSSVDVTSVEKVGVGEVFIIAGQSNAQGVKNYGELGATDDRVNCVNATKENNTFEDITTNLTISQLSQRADIAPNGRGAWCWGELGDKLVQRLGVPVMFFNAAWTGTLAINWYESALGFNTFSAIFQGVFPYPHPYQNLRISLNYYGSLFGVRAVLWHQGETDTFPGTPNRDQYYGYIKGTIERSRIDFGRNVPWVISKVSHSFGRNSDEVLAGQQRVLDTPNLNVFRGPSTDNIQIPRPDGVHFQNTVGVRGISQLANVWNDALTQEFFNSASPIAAQSIAEFRIACQGNNQVRLQLPVSHAPIRWNDGTRDTEKNTSTTEYFAIVRDNTGNIKYTPAVNPRAVDFNLPTPIITGSATTICQGETAILAVNQSYEKYIWSDGVETQNQRNATQANAYSVRGLNAVGCTSNSSPLYSLVVNPIPEKPSIIDEGKKLVCDGEKITLRSSDNTNSIRWSDGSVSRSIELSRIADYSIQLTARNQFGCENKSDIVRYFVKPNPVKPRVLTTDPSIVCDGKTIRLTSSDSTNKILWTDGSINRTNVLSAVKDYVLQVRSETEFGCQSPLSDTVRVAIKPNPEKPQITTSDPLLICEGLKIKLNSNDNVNKSVWSNGLTTSSIELANAGEYKVSVYSETQFGCKSPTSDSLAATIKARPAQPRIINESIFGLRVSAVDTATVDGFEWTFDGQRISQNKIAHYTKQIGKYQVNTFKIYPIANRQPLVCPSLLSEIFNHNPDPKLVDIRFYPNPTHQYIYLESRADVTDAKLNIYSINGILIDTVNLGELSSRKVIDLRTYPKGRYVFSVINGSFESAKVVVIE